LKEMIGKVRTLNMKQSWCFNMQLIKRLRHWKFTSTLRILNHCALNRRWATGARECSAISYVEDKIAFRALHNLFGLRIHSLSLSLIQALNDRLITFLKMLPCLCVEVLSTLKTIQYGSSESIIVWE